MLGFDREAGEAGTVADTRQNFIDSRAIGAFFGREHLSFLSVT